ncbi:MAG TPA: GntR family transcriptional regulator, partial [Anaerolineaceae bacterium]|nr:GntR family transcriptional regulator [Anaerolineaceae bacterium]
MKKEKSKAENQNAFLKLQEDLTRLIEKTSSGDKLPSEPELAKSLGVSRATLREAMRLFESRGMLRRRQGVGTFVEPQAKVIESGLEVLESIERMSRRLGLSVTMGELKVTDVLVGVDIAEKLQVEGQRG